MNLIYAFTAISAVFTLLMIFIAIPLSIIVVEAFLNALNSHDLPKVRASLKTMTTGLAILLLPYLFGIAGSITFCSNQNNSINSKFITCYCLFAIIIYGCVPIVLDKLRLAFKLPQNTKLAKSSSSILGVWFGLMWIFLYLSLAIQLYTGLLGPL